MWLESAVLDEADGRGRGRGALGITVMAWADWYKGFFPSRRPKPRGVPLPAATVSALVMYCDCCKRPVDSFKTFADGERLCFECASHRR